jgi:hypothetical protein
MSEKSCKLSIKQLIQTWSGKGNIQINQYELRGKIINILTATLSAKI